MNLTQPESTARLRSALEPLQFPKHLRISLQMHKNPLRFPLHRFLLPGSFLQQPMEKLVRLEGFEPPTCCSGGEWLQVTQSTIPFPPMRLRAFGDSAFARNRSPFRPNR
jgi:hypothetical protein